MVIVTQSFSPTNDVRFVTLACCNLFLGCPILRAAKGGSQYAMPATSMSPDKQRSKISILFTSTVRVLFTTLIFTAGAMGLGLLLGIVGMIAYGLVTGVQPDMRNAYRHVAIPLAVTIGCIALIGALYLEVRARRTRG